MYYIRTDAVLTPQRHHPEELTPTLFVYENIRTLRGVIESHYYASESRATTEKHHTRTLGPRAAQYVIAHGYTAEAIETILETKRKVSTGEQFAGQLAAQGMAFKEAYYLYSLFEWISD
jgi:hypothetical protein